MEILDRLEQYWHRNWQAVATDRPTPASTQDLSEFEQMHQVTFPLDFREYLQRFNGIEEDPDLFCLWPINKIRRLDSKGFHLLQAESYYYFADYLIECHYYAIYLGNDGFFQNRVILPDFPGSPVIANTFTEFLELYLKDDPKLFGHV